MTLIRRVDDALLDMAGALNGLLRTMFDVDQWTTARCLARLYVVLVVACQYAMMLERGFAWGNMIILALWLWQYVVLCGSIDRCSRSSAGSSIARIGEYAHRSLYAFIYGVLVLIVVAAGSHLSGILMLAGFASMVVASYVKAAEMPPPDRTRLRLQPSL